MSVCLCLYKGAGFDTHNYKEVYTAVSSLPMASLVMDLSKSQIDDYIFDLMHLKFPGLEESAYKVFFNSTIFKSLSLVDYRC